MPAVLRLAPAILLCYCVFTSKVIADADAPKVTNPGPEYVLIEWDELRDIPETIPRLRTADFDGTPLECAYMPLYEDKRETTSYRTLVRSGELHNYLGELTINTTIANWTVTYTMAEGLQIVSDQGVAYEASTQHISTKQIFPDLFYKSTRTPTRYTDTPVELSDSPEPGCLLNKEAIQAFINDTFTQDKEPTWLNDETRVLYTRGRLYMKMCNSSTEPRKFYYRMATANVTQNLVLLHNRIANYAPYDPAALMRIQTLYEGYCIADASKQAVANIYLTCLPGAENHKLISISVRHDMCGHDIIFGSDYICNIKEIYTAVKRAWNVQTVLCARVLPQGDAM